uniref:Ig-like domain-containing protein n=1 Tax=Coturnix japonica TaxID=93934 RepID=A0A8C2YG46_COTJA
MPGSCCCLSSGVCAQIRLAESGGGSVKVSCHGYGVKLGGVWWYRQAPGGHLKWLSGISTDSYVVSSPEVKGRVKGFRDNSQAIISLSLHNLCPEDSARYFCAVTQEQDMLQRSDKNPFLDTVMVAGGTGLEVAGEALCCSWGVMGCQSTPQTALPFLQSSFVLTTPSLLQIPVSSVSIHLVTHLILLNHKSSVGT